MVFQHGRPSFGRILMKLSLFKGERPKWFLALGNFLILRGYADWICHVLGTGDCTVIWSICINIWLAIWLETLRAVDSSTRGHPLKILKPRCIKNVRQRSFTQRSIYVWNWLPAHIVTAPSLNGFKSNFDKVWKKESEFYFDYKADMIAN